MPNLTLTLEALGCMGVVLPSEIRAAVDTSLPLKRMGAGLLSLQLWGRLRTTTGKDYYVAVGYSKVPYYFEQKFVEDRRVFISQNGVDWVDLPAFPAEKAGSAAKITAWLTGDLSFVSSVPEEPPPPPPVPEGEAPPDPPEPVVVEVTEMERISWMFNEITAATRIVPKGYLIVNGANELVPNKGYSGLSFPEKLDSYIHYAGAALTEDLPGMWAITYDEFSQTAFIRHLEWPGFSFFFSNETKDYGAFYVGSGVKNGDILFMI